jgi:hypothetical protein
MKLETEQDVKIAVSDLFQGAEEAQIGERLERILDSIEKRVLPVNSRVAFELIVSLIEQDREAMDCCGDHHYFVAAAVNRAICLFAKAGKALPAGEVRRTLERLIAEDTYCTREALGELAGHFS